MNIIVCYKLVPDSEDVTTRPDGSISYDQAEWVISDYDLMAIEAGLKLVETHGGKLIALSAGPGQLTNSKAKKDILSRGPDELVLVVDEGLLNADTHTTAQVLAAAARKIGEFDLVLCGEGSADLYYQQAGMQLGAILDLPVFNAASKIDFDGNQILIDRSLEDEVEVLSIPAPAVISVTTDINQPRLPTMKQILMAGKKPIREWSLGDLGIALPPRRVHVVSDHAPRQVDRKKVRLEGKADEMVSVLLGYLSKEGVL